MKLEMPAWNPGLALAGSRVVGELRAELDDPVALATVAVADASKLPAVVVARSGIGALKSSARVFLTSPRSGKHRAIKSCRSDGRPFHGTESGQAGPIACQAVDIAYLGRRQLGRGLGIRRGRRVLVRDLALSPMGHCDQVE